MTGHSGPDKLWDLAFHVIAGNLQVICELDDTGTPRRLQVGVKLPWVVCDQLISCLAQKSSLKDSSVVIFSDTKKASLKRVNLSKSEITDIAIMTLRKQRPLELDVHGCEYLTEQCLPDLMELESLQSLNLSRCPKILVNYNHVMDFKLPELLKLDISYTELSKLHLYYLTMNLPKLMALDVSGVVRNGDMTFLTPHRTRLVTLVLHDCIVLESSLREICKVRTLRHLDISVADVAFALELTPSMLRYLVHHLPSLTYLDLSGNNFKSTRVEMNPGNVHPEDSMETDEVDGIEADGESSGRHEPSNHGRDHESSQQDGREEENNNNDNTSKLWNTFNRTFEFLGLLYLEEVFADPLPARRVASSSCEANILTALQAYKNRKPFALSAMNSFFDTVRAVDCKQVVSCVEAKPLLVLDQILHAPDWEGVAKITSQTDDPIVLSAMSPTRLRALARTCSMSPIATRSYKLFVDKEGTMVSFQAITSIMRNYPGDEKIQIPGSASLFHLSRSNHRVHFTNQTNQLIISSLVDAMELTGGKNITLLRNCGLTLLNFDIPNDFYFDFERIVKSLINVVKLKDSEGLLPRIYVYMCNSIVCHVEGDLKLLVGKLGLVECMLQLIRVGLEKRRYDEVMETAWSALWNVTDETPYNCDVFVSSDGLLIFLSSLNTFPGRPDLLRNMMGLIGNVAEVPVLRPHLLRHIKVFMDLLKNMSDGIEVSYNAAGTLSHIASDSLHGWVEGSVSREDMLLHLEAAIDSWDLNAQRNINYRSFQPILRLLDAHHTYQVQLWATWAITNLCIVSPDKYCTLLRRENGLEKLERLLQWPETHRKVRELVLKAISTCREQHTVS